MNGQDSSRSPLPAELEPLLAALATARTGTEADDLLEGASESILAFHQLGLILFAHDDLLLWSSLQTHSDPMCRALRLAESLDIACAPRFVRGFAFPDGCSVTITRLPGTAYERLVPVHGAAAGLPPSVAERFWRDMAKLLEHGWLHADVARYGTDVLLVDPATNVGYVVEGWKGLRAVTDVSADDLDAYRAKIRRARSAT